MENNSCYTPLCPRRETCTLWLNALASIDKGATQLCITNPKIIEEAGATTIAPSITSTSSDNLLGV